MRLGHAARDQPMRPGRPRLLDISVSPNAKRMAANGLHDGALRLRLRLAAPSGQPQRRGMIGRSCH